MLVESTLMRIMLGATGLPPVSSSQAADSLAPATIFGLDLYELFLALLVLLLVMLLITWTMWLAGLGRFQRKDHEDSEQMQSSTSRTLLQILPRIIDDFRHLLALVILGIFLITMLVMLVAAWPDSVAMRDGLELVVASLGGLVGSIVGYYFGESAARKAIQKSNDQPPSIQQPTPPDQQPPAAPHSKPESAGTSVKSVIAPPGLDSPQD